MICKGLAVRMLTVPDSFWLSVSKSDHVMLPVASISSAFSLFSPFHNLDAMLQVPIPITNMVSELRPKNHGTPVIPGIVNTMYWLFHVTVHDSRVEVQIEC